MQLQDVKPKPRRLPAEKKLKALQRERKERSPLPLLIRQNLKIFLLEIKAIGNVESYATVSIKARVSGELQKVHFAEGQEVAKGKLLFTIDPRPFQAALDEVFGTA